MNKHSKRQIEYLPTKPGIQLQFHDEEYQNPRPADEAISQEKFIKEEWIYIGLHDRR